MLSFMSENMFRRQFCNLPSYVNIYNYAWATVNLILMHCDSFHSFHASCNIKIWLNQSIKFVANKLMLLQDTGIHNASYIPVTVH